MILTFYSVASSLLYFPLCNAFSYFIFIWKLFSCQILEKHLRYLFVSVFFFEVLHMYYVSDEKIHFAQIQANLINLFHTNYWFKIILTTFKVYSSICQHCTDTTEFEPSFSPVYKCPLQMHFAVACISTSVAILPAYFILDLIYSDVEAFPYKCHAHRFLCKRSFFPACF